MRLNPVVAQIVSASNFDHFLAVEVRSAYLALVDDKSLDPNKARRLVYTELIKLVKQGWLRKSVSKKKEVTTFIKTELFDSKALRVNLVSDAPDQNGKTTGEGDELSNELFVRLSHYKNDLLTGLGEVDEYKRLCEQFPELQQKLQPKYNEVREANSKLLGSIKAIESVMAKAV